MGGEPPVDEVNWGVDTDQIGLSSPWARQPVQTLFRHDRVDQLVVDVHVVVGQQRGADPSAPVGAARTLVDLDDRVGHDESPHLTVGDTAAPVVLP